MVLVAGRPALQLYNAKRQISQHCIARRHDQILQLLNHYGCD